MREATPDEIENVYEIRAELEGLGARRFSERPSDEQRSELPAALAQLKTATAAGLGRSADILTAQARFNSALFMGAASPLLEQLVQGLQARVAQFRATTLLAPGRAVESLSDFERIVEAIEDRARVEGGSCRGAARAASG